MDTRKLRYFVTVAQLGSFTKAALKLNIAQSALSRHIKSLEEDLGVRLFRRDAKGLSQTRDGEQLLVSALDILERLNILRRQVGVRSDEIAGRVVIGLPTSASAVLSTIMLREAFERFPLIQIHLIETLSGYLEEWIEAGKIDLAIIFDGRTSSGIRLEPILVEDLWLVGAATSLPASVSEVELTELPRFRLLLPGPLHSHRRLVERMALSHNVSLNVAAEVDSLSIQKAMVADGNLFAILALSAVHQEVAAGSLRAVRIVSPTISRSVALASALSRSENNACNAMAHLILEISRRLVSTKVWQAHLT